MKYLNLFLVILLFVSAVFTPIVMAQSNLLPEKSNTTSADNTNNGSLSSSSESSTPSSSAEKSDKTLAWALSIVGIMLFALFLLFLEIAIIPGFGIAGISGTILLLVSLGLAFWKLTKVWAIGVTVFAVIGVGFLIYFMVEILPQTKLGKKFILSETAPAPEDISAVDNTARFLGAEGVAVSNLRPSGIAKIADERVDVITDGDFIEKGTKIKVIKTTAGRVIVSVAD